MHPESLFKNDNLVHYNQIEQHTMSIVLKKQQLGKDTSLTFQIFSKNFKVKKTAIANKLNAKLFLQQIRDLNLRL